MIPDMESEQYGTAGDTISLEKEADGLKRLMSESYGLYLKINRCVWSIPDDEPEEISQVLSHCARELYRQLADISEELRRLGYDAPNSYRDFERIYGLKTVNFSEHAEFSGDCSLKDLLTGFYRLLNTIIEVDPLVNSPGQPDLAEMLTRHTAENEHSIRIIKKAIYDRHHVTK